MKTATATAFLFDTKPTDRGFSPSECLHDAPLEKHLNLFSRATDLVCPLCDSTVAESFQAVSS